MQRKAAILGWWRPIFFNIRERTAAKQWFLLRHYRTARKGYNVLKMSVVKSHWEFICHFDHLYLGCLRSIRMRRRSLASSILSGSLWEKLSSWSNRVQRFCSFIRSPDLSCFPTETQCTPPGKQPGEENNNKRKAFEQESFFERFLQICSRSVPIFNPITSSTFLDSRYNSYL